MNHYCIYQIFLVLLLLITFVSGRALYYDQLDEDDDAQELDTNVGQWDNDEGDSNQSYDSEEERKFHARGLFSSSRAPHTISTHTRQALLEILQKAFDSGWRPSLKHYIPATRFGRHRR